MAHSCPREYVEYNIQILQVLVADRFDEGTHTTLSLEEQIMTKRMIRQSYSSHGCYDYCSSDRYEELMISEKMIWTWQVLMRMELTMARRQQKEQLLRQTWKETMMMIPE